jgi:hypothetical protein
MNNNLEFENEDPCPNGIEDNHPRTNYGNYGEGCIVKETLEEAGRLYSEKVKSNKTSHMLGFYNGAKWQQERMYTEEEIHYIIESYQNNVENNPVHITYEEWFEQFKKK